jgi:hypothetical protein
MFKPFVDWNEADVLLFYRWMSPLGIELSMPVFNQLPHRIQRLYLRRMAAEGSALEQEIEELRGQIAEREAE